MDKPVFTCKLRRTKAQLRFTAESKVLASLFEQSHEYVRSLHRSLRNHLSYNPIPMEFWVTDVGNEGGHTMQLTAPMSAADLESVLDGLKRGVERFLRDYATPYEGTVTIVRGQL